ncbi:MAG: Asp-tRNA(Asn)/Glu-tRNA(Gln) amidotransferase GatCAB subunit A, partial [Deltaproteobacteria bacterium CG07_land_8_20_14_0_80_38_7]
MIDLSCETISSLHKLLIEGKINSVELTELYLNRIEQKNNKINAYVSLNQDAIKEAREADLRIQAKKNVTELTGIPIGLKDIFLKSRLKTTCASNILKNYIAPYTGTAVQKLADAGAVIIGKLNMDEFAMGSSTEHTIFGPTHNPWNHEYIAGGSSGGSTAAVAASFCAAALGTDTGGSIRQPSSCCNVVGLKPTYGRVSRYGVVAFASSLDQVGPITTNVADCA